MNQAVQKKIGIWLLCGVLMIFVQIVVGGITRLTGSGLSITKWEVVTGTLPPLNNADWQEEFEKYKITPQYKQLNEGMSLGEFKFIYFWEYIHRLWARLMGFVFAIPLAFFLAKGWINRALLGKLSIVLILAGLVASFGWIMVKSGLVDRPWVNAYKLTIHLSLALILYAYVLWLALSRLFPSGFVINAPLKKLSSFILILLSLQLVLGGLMSGMKAGLFYPTFPDMNGEFIPGVLLSPGNWNLDSFIHYHQNPFAVSLIHFSHRITAYILFILIWIFFFKLKRISFNGFRNLVVYSLPLLVTTQVLLGIIVILNSKGYVPVGLGVLHQAVAIFLLSALVVIHYFLRKDS